MLSCADLDRGLHELPADSAVTQREFDRDESDSGKRLHRGVGAKLNPLERPLLHSSPHFSLRTNAGYLAVMTGGSAGVRPSDSATAVRSAAPSARLGEVGEPRSYRFLGGLRCAIRESRKVLITVARRIGMLTNFITGAIECMD